MKKKFIIAISFIVFIYLVICLFFLFSYNSTMEKLDPPEQRIYTSNLQTYSKTDDIFSVYLTDNNILFRRISHIDLAPFEWVKVPKIQFEYNYCISEPKKSTHYEGDTAFEVFLNEQSLIAKSYTVPDPEARKSGFNPYYFGFFEHATNLSGVDEFRFYHPLNNGYIFCFYATENPAFDEDLYFIAN